MDVLTTTTAVQRHHHFYNVPWFVFSRPNAQFVRGLHWFLDLVGDKNGKGSAQTLTVKPESLELKVRVNICSTIFKQWKFFSNLMNFL